MNMMHIENKNVQFKDGRFVIDDPFTAGIPVSSLIEKLDRAVSIHKPTDTGVSYLALVRTDVVPYETEHGYKISPLFDTNKHVLARMESYHYPVEKGLPIVLSKEQITKDEADTEGTLIVFIVDMDSGETVVTLSLEIEGSYEVNSTSLDIDEGAAKELLRILRRIICSHKTDFYKS